MHDTRSKSLDLVTGNNRNALSRVDEHFLSADPGAADHGAIAILGMVANQPPCIFVLERGAALPDFVPRTLHLRGGGRPSEPVKPGGQYVGRAISLGPRAMARTW